MALVLPCPVCTPEALYVILDMLIATDLAHILLEAGVTLLSSEDQALQSASLGGWPSWGHRVSLERLSPPLPTRVPGMLSESCGNVIGFSAAQAELPREDYGNLA